MFASSNTIPRIHVILCFDIQILNYYLPPLSNHVRRHLASVFLLLQPSSIDCASHLVSSGPPDPPGPPPNAPRLVSHRSTQLGEVVKRQLNGNGTSTITVFTVVEASA